MKRGRWLAIATMCMALALQPSIASSTCWYCDNSRCNEVTGGHGYDSCSDGVNHTPDGDFPFCSESGGGCTVGGGGGGDDGGGGGGGQCTWTDWWEWLCCSEGLCEDQ